MTQQEVSRETVSREALDEARDKIGRARTAYEAMLSIHRQEGHDPMTMGKQVCCRTCGGHLGKACAWSPDQIHHFPDEISYTTGTPQVRLVTGTLRDVQSHGGTLCLFCGE